MSRLLSVAYFIKLCCKSVCVRVSECLFIVSLPVCLCLSIFVCPPAFLSACLIHACLSAFLSVCLLSSLSGCLLASLYVCLPTPLSACLPVCPSVYLPAYLAVCISVLLPACLLRAYLSVSLYLSILRRSIKKQTL